MTQELFQQNLSALWICSQEKWNTEFQLNAAGADVHEFPSFTPLFLSLFFLLKVQDRFSISSLSKTYYNHYQVAESPLLPPNTRYGGFYLILCASFPRRKASSRDKACCWSRKNLCRKLVVNLRKLGFCRLWNFLGNPSQRSEVEQARNGVCWHLNLIFFKCGTQAVVGCRSVVLQAVLNYFLCYLPSIILMFLYSILKWISGLVFLR